MSGDVVVVCSTPGNDTPNQRQPQRAQAEVHKANVANVVSGYDSAVILDVHTDTAGHDKVSILCRAATDNTEKVACLQYCNSWKVLCSASACSCVTLPELNMQLMVTATRSCSSYRMEVMLDKLY